MVWTGRGARGWSGWRKAVHALVLLGLVAAVVRSHWQPLRPVERYIHFVLNTPFDFNLAADRVAARLGVEHQLGQLRSVLGGSLGMTRPDAATLEAEPGLLPSPGERTRRPAVPGP